MNDLSPTEIDALARAMGTSSPHPEPAVSDSPQNKREKEKRALSIESMKSGISRAQLVQLRDEADHLQALNDEEQEHLQEVKLELEVVLGRTKISIEKFLKLQIGSVLSLDTLAGEPVELFANGNKIASGEIVIIEEENFGIKILEFMSK